MAAWAEVLGWLAVQVVLTTLEQLARAVSAGAVLGAVCVVGVLWILLGRQ